MIFPPIWVTFLWSFLEYGFFSPWRMYNELLIRLIFSDSYGKNIIFPELEAWKCFARFRIRDPTIWMGMVHGIRFLHRDQSLFLLAKLHTSWITLIFFLFLVRIGLLHVQRHRIPNQLSKTAIPKDELDDLSWFANFLKNVSIFSSWSWRWRLTISSTVKDLHDGRSNSFLVLYY